MRLLLIEVVPFLGFPFRFVSVWQTTPSPGLTSSPGKATESRWIAHDAKCHPRPGGGRIRKMNICGFSDYAKERRKRQPRRWPRQGALIQVIWVISALVPSLDNQRLATKVPQTLFYNPMNASLLISFQLPSQCEQRLMGQTPGGRLSVSKFPPSDVHLRVLAMAYIAPGGYFGRLYEYDKYRYYYELFEGQKSSHRGT